MDKKILFYASNSVGLGHLRRSILLANLVKKEKPKTDILFATLSKSPHFLKENNISFVRLTPASDGLIKKGRKSILKTKEKNREKFIKTIYKHKPDTIVVDVFLFGFSFPFEILDSEFGDIKKVLIFRLADKEKYQLVLKKRSEILSEFDKIIIPHSEEEVARILSKKEFKNIKKDKKFFISGSIVKSISKKNISECRVKYKIKNNDFLITVSLGGGGEIVNANCKSPFWVAKRTVEIFEEIKKEETKARMIICVGPSFKYLDKLKKEVKRRKLKIKLISFEKNLPELFTLSSLIISTAGYNVCNEIVQARVPSVLVPLDRDSKEQYERAKFLKNVGVARVVDKDSKNIFKKEVKSALKNTKKMKKSFLKLNLGKIKRNKVVKELL